MTTNTAGLKTEADQGDKRRVLIDTCGWVDFLRSGSGALGDQVERAMVEDRACLCSVSVAELLQGVKGQKEKRQLEVLFGSVPLLDVEPADWLSAGQALQALRGKGFQIPLTDALIAAVAIRNGLPVLTVDKHFAHFGGGGGGVSLGTRRPPKVQRRVLDS